MLLFNSYCDFLVQEWDKLWTGNYKKIDSRPKITYKEHLTDEMVALNAPDLSKDEELLTKLDESVEKDAQK